MGRAPCCEKVGLKKGRWTAEEDEILVKYIQANGEGSWRSLPKNAGLKRCGKSCRLRWINYLRADLKRGNISAEEQDIIMKLHKSMGNRWSLIAGYLPGRTDNEIKNYWNSHLSRRIDCFRRPISTPGEALQILMDPSPKMGRAGTKRGSSARKSQVSNANVATEEIEKDAVVQDEVSINKSIVSDCSEVEGEERESLSSGSHKEGGSGLSMGPSENTTEDLMLSPNEERQQEILGEELEFDVLFLDEVLSDSLHSNKDDDGMLMSSQCIKESEDRESGLEKDTVVQDEVSINKSIASDGPEVEGEERESLSSGSHKEGGSGPIMGPSESATEDLTLSPNEERQQEFLGEELEFDVLFLNELLSDNLQSNKDDDGVLMSSQCIKESDDRESGPALSSNGENVGWYSFSPIASCFEEDWAKWDMWESAFDQCDDQKQLWGSDHRGENLELLHSWLWDSDH